MKTTRTLALFLAAALAAHTYGGDAKVTLSSTDGTSAFTVRDSASNEIARVQSDGKVGIGTNAPAYSLDVLGDINLTGTLRTNGVAWTPLASFTELDPLFGVSVAAGIVNADLVNWNAAFGWGNHALAGYLTAYTETDPVFGASAAAGIGAPQLANWNAAFGWGNHALAGYLTAYTETDPVFGASAAAGIGAPQLANWNAAFGWGNHAIAGYLTAYTETDPVFTVSVAAGITTDSTNAWNAKVSGSGTEGYLSKFTASGTVGDSALFSDADGNVGIGTATPASKFQVYGTETGANWAGRGVFGGASNSVVLGQYNNKAYFGAHNGTLEGWSDLTINPGGGNVLLANGGGNVGIGTETPAYKLDVVGSFNATGITIGGVPVASSTDTYWSTNASAAGSIQYSGGNVGIGTAMPAPSAALDVSATDKGMLVPRLSLVQRDAVVAPATGLLIYQTDNTPGFYFYNGTEWASVSAGGAVVSSIAATAPLASSGGSTPTLSLPAATASANGYLASTDWTTFNNKVATTRTVSTTAPLTGGGALSGNLTLALPAATTSVSGYLTSANWTTFNAKESALTFSSPISRSVNAISIPVATTSANGYLSSTDWTTFNNKVATTRTVSTTAPLTGGGALSGNLTLALPAATTSVNGYLSSTDWTAFNAKAGAGANSTITSLSGLTTPLSAAQGGSGLSGYTIGDMLYASGATALSRLADVATGNTLLSGGVGGAPAWGKVGLSTHVSGTLPVANGGTAATTAADARANLGLGTAATLAASSANASSAVVQRDASGNFSAGTITATLSGSATFANTATKASNLVGGNSTTLYGAMPYQFGADATTLVVPNTTTTKKFLSMTGSGVNGGSPVWDTFSAAAPGANSDITSLSGLTTDITVAQGGTGVSTLTGVVHGNGTAAMTAGAVALASEVSGTLPVANGGTGASTLTANKVLVGNGTSAVLQPTNLHWDNTNSRLGVKDSTPSYTVDVAGDVNVTGAFRVNGTAINAGTLDYAMARMDQGVSASGISVPWSTTYLRGQITTNTTKTAFLLIAGKTYELECALVASSGLAQYLWTASDSTFPLGSPSIYGTSYPTTYSAAAYASQPKATTIFTPSTNTFVRVYISLLGPGAGITTGNLGCYAIIRELR